MIEKILKMKKEKVNTRVYRKKQKASMRKSGWYGTEYIEGFKFAKIVPKGKIWKNLGRMIRMNLKK